MDYSYWLSLTLLLVQGFGHISCACQFPDEWSGDWFRSYQSATNDDSVLRVYTDNTIYEGRENKLISKREATECFESVEEDDFFNPESRYFYLTEAPRSRYTIQQRNNNWLCNKDVKDYNGGVILHGEMLVPQGTTANACKAMDFDSTEKNFFILGQLVREDFFCPFVNGLYQFEYTDQSNTDHCVDDYSSYANMAESGFKVNSCYTGTDTNNFETPFNNREFGCVTVFDGPDMDGVNDGVILLASSRTDNPNRVDIYCARFTSGINTYTISVNAEDENLPMCQPSHTPQDAGGDKFKFEFEWFTPSTIVAPTTAEPTTVAPTTTTPTTVAPTTTTPTTVAPTTTTPTTVAPTTTTPTTVAPTTTTPTTVAPTTTTPTTVAPTTTTPTTVAPATTMPTTVAPTTTAPTTVAPSTTTPSTAAPTTTTPTTVAPTTTTPSTAAPTTTTPTTVAPTTTAPSTVVATETPLNIEQTTAKPTTVAPTTTTMSSIAPTTTTAAPTTTSTTTTLRTPPSTPSRWASYPTATPTKSTIPVPYSDLKEHIQLCFQNQFDVYVGQGEEASYAQHLVWLLSTALQISLDRLQKAMVMESPSGGGILLDFELLPAGWRDEKPVGEAILVLQTMLNSNQITFEDPNKNLLFVCPPPSFWHWRDDSYCPDRQCGIWRPGMTWEDAGGRCRIIQGTYSCVCTNEARGMYCMEPTSGGDDSGTSRNTIILIIVVVVVAFIIITLIIVFLCARYAAGGSPQDDEVMIYDDPRELDSDLALKSIYSTASRGKPMLAYNNSAFQGGEPIIVETMSLGKGTVLR